jgi:hypothetical protein
LRRDARGNRRQCRGTGRSALQEISTIDNGLGMISHNSHLELLIGLLYITGIVTHATEGDDW